MNPLAAATASPAWAIGSGIHEAIPPSGRGGDSGGPAFTTSPDDFAVYRECPRVPLADLPQVGPEARAAAREVARATGLPPHARADVAEWRGPR